ncbi:MAG: response regulator [Bacteroidota bacterium]
MGKLIFFVDDDRMIINLLEYTFQSRQKYTVRSFSSGEACLEHLNERPDLIVLDHVLSGPGHDGMDGLETLLEIRKTDKKIPVIVLTGHGDDKLLSRFMDAGVKRFLTKDDFFVDSLMESIDQLLN